MLNPYTDADNFCIDCPFMAPPYYIRINCPACDRKALLDLRWQFRWRKFKLYIAAVNSKESV